MKHEKTPDPLALLGLAAASLRIETLPAEVVQRSKQRVLDTIGCLIAGYHAGIADAIRSYVLAQGGAPEATLLPGGQKTTVALAGLAHATYIHGLELSDAAPRATVHPGKEIIPAALALAELYARRWEHELYFREAKRVLRQTDVLQSHTVETGAQEIAAIIRETAV